MTIARNNHRLKAALSFRMIRFALPAMLAFGAIACQDGGAREQAPPVLIPRGQVEREVGGVAVTIYTPPETVAKEIRGDVLVLPGWKYNRKRWLNETPIKSEADRLGLRLICPEMGRSIYASRYFPETGPRWNSNKAGLAWVLEDLLPYLAGQGVFRSGAAANNFLLGLSTGGRGVALIALARPDLIRAAAALSGDFDQTLQPADRLMAGHYGSYADFRERWETVDNPLRQAAGWSTPIYLAHGTQDRVVPPVHSQEFFESLRTAHPQLDVVLLTPSAGHDFAFWGAQTAPAFAFFEKYLRTDS
ncbi:MAG: prolyl oligopeptidase family serine peptidase [Leptospirales bacterium]|jgi:putative tributyrin esterase